VIRPVETTSSSSSSLLLLFDDNDVNIIPTSLKIVEGNAKKTEYESQSMQSMAGKLLCNIRTPLKR